MVTCVGDTFAGRVGGSLLQAVGLPELITTNMEDYFRLALRLATDSQQLAAVKNKLAQQNQTAPLFDSERFTRNMENLYLRMWQAKLDGERLLEH